MFIQATIDFKFPNSPSPYVFPHIGKYYQHIKDFTENFYLFLHNLGYTQESSDFQY